MKVCVEPTGLYSRAMTRVAAALQQHAPEGIEFVSKPSMADFAVSHVIGPDPAPDWPEVIIQYCLRSAGRTYPDWADRWRKSKLVWSYYDLPEITGQNGFPFYFAPLGVDEVFTKDFDDQNDRDIGIMTSGYVSSPIGEAVEEVAVAAWMLGLDHAHLGPAQIEGMKVKVSWRSLFGVSDENLAYYYRRCKWVSGLRHVEGFELPIIEGLCCGARPIVFDRPDMRQWYNGHAVFIPECSGTELVRILLDVLEEEPEPVTRDEREWVIKRFDWKFIAKDFWRSINA